MVLLKYTEKKKRGEGRGKEAVLVFFFPSLLVLWSQLSNLLTDSPNL